MWNTLTGTVNAKENSILFIQAGSLEWAIRMPALSLFNLPGRGEEAKVFLYLHHKEDDMTLFGFASSEREGSLPPTSEGLRNRPQTGDTNTFGNRSGGSGESS